MATNFPASLDSFTNPTSGTAMNASSPLTHSVQHININDAMTAVQAKVGVDGSTSASSLDVRAPTICTSSTRPTGVVGRTIYETDTGDFLVYYGATTGWRPPWPRPWGLITHVHKTTNDTRSVTTLAEVSTDYRSTVTTVANRRLRFTFAASMTNSGGGGLVEVYNNTTSAAVGRIMQFNSLTAGDVTDSGVLIATSAAGSTQYTLRFQAVTGGTFTLVGSSVPTQFTIEDLGPTTATAPTS